MIAKVVLILGFAVAGVTAGSLGQQRAGDTLIGGAITAAMFLLGKSNGNGNHTNGSKGKSND